jgi:hypothetical protein
MCSQKLRNGRKVQSLLMFNNVVTSGLDSRYGMLVSESCIGSSFGFTRAFPELSIC